MYHELNTDTADPVVLVKIDVTNSFNEGDSRTNLDMIVGMSRIATRDYTFGPQNC